MGGFGSALPAFGSLAGGFGQGFQQGMQLHQMQQQMQMQQQQMQLAMQAAQQQRLFQQAQMQHMGAQTQYQQGELGLSEREQNLKEQEFQKAHEPMDESDIALYGTGNDALIGPQEAQHLLSLPTPPSKRDFHAAMTMRLQVAREQAYAAAQKAAASASQARTNQMPLTAVDKELSDLQNKMMTPGYMVMTPPEQQDADKARVAELLRQQAALKPKAGIQPAPQTAGSAEDFWRQRLGKKP